VLVPPVIKNTTAPTAPTFSDRPDGHDPRDQYIGTYQIDKQTDDLRRVLLVRVFPICFYTGHKRIDMPIVNGTKTNGIAKVRFNCIESLADPVYISSFSLHKKSVPWE
jgi:hypothetical protein